MTAEVGMRVLRGPHWQGGDADGGDGHLGTLRALLGDGQVRVLWDNGKEMTCKAGADGKYELRILDTAQVGEFLHRYGGGRITSCAEPVWTCRCACAGNSGQKLLLVVVRRSANQIGRVRIVMRAINTEFTCHRVVLVFCHSGAREPVYYAVCVELVPHAVVSDLGQSKMVFSASGMARSCLLF